jgi:hypothetical protein
MTNNFYAILTDDTVRNINLTRPITSGVRNIFLTAGEGLAEKDAVLFTGNYKVEEDEILYVNMHLPENVAEVAVNALGIDKLDLNADSVKALFWYEDGIYYFQNFDNRRLLRNKNVIVYTGNTYSRLEENAFVIEPQVNGLYADGNFYFTNYINANKIFSLADYYHEATDQEIQLFASSDKVVIDEEWFMSTNTVIRKNISLLQKSNVLATINTKKVRRHAAKFKLAIELDSDGKIVFPNDHRATKDILTFLNEQFFQGLITGKPYRTNSKRDI